MLLAHSCWVAMGWTAIRRHVKNNGRSPLPGPSAPSVPLNPPKNLYAWIIGGYAASVSVFSLIRGLLDMLVGPCPAPPVGGLGGPLDPLLRAPLSVSLVACIAPVIVAPVWEEVSSGRRGVNILDDLTTCKRA